MSKNSTYLFDQQVERIARAFSRNLRDELSAGDMLQVIALNRLPTRHPGCCHSHDFCDANMPMLAAFEAETGMEPAADDVVCAELWNAAWNKARESEFATE